MTHKRILKMFKGIGRAPKPRGGKVGIGGDHASIGLPKGTKSLNLSPAQEAKRKEAFAGKQFQIKVKPISSKPPAATVRFELHPGGRTKSSITLPRKRR